MTDDNNKEEALELSRSRGLTYNEAKAYIARTTGGKNTHIYSDTDAQAVREKNAESMRRKED